MDSPDALSRKKMTMHKVTRAEIRSRQDYESARDEFRRKVFAQKQDRRIHLGPCLTFLFENHDTILYQVQEMIRTEGIDGEPAIQHEIDTYNELLGDRGELGCTLLIEISDEAERAPLLARWTNLQETLYLTTQGGERSPAQFDPRQVGTDRISSVQYLKFAVGDRVLQGIGCSHPDFELEVELEPRQVAALSMDLVTS